MLYRPQSCKCLCQTLASTVMISKKKWLGLPKEEQSFDVMGLISWPRKGKPLNWDYVNEGEKNAAYKTYCIQKTYSTQLAGIIHIYSLRKLCDSHIICTHIVWSDFVKLLSVLHLQKVELSLNVHKTHILHYITKE